MLKNIDINSIDLFVKVIEEGSFSKVADKYNIPISTLSRKINGLEKKIGVKLIYRTTRSLSITKLGESYFNSCKKGLAIINDAYLTIRDKSKSISGNFNLSVPVNLSDSIIVPLISSFQNIYPEISINCHVTDILVDHIDKNIDISIRIGHLKDSTLIAKLLGFNKCKLVCSPLYFKKIQNIKDIECISEHVYIAFSKPTLPIKWELYDIDNNNKTINSNPKLIINDYIGLLQSILNHNGVSAIPDNFCNKYIDDGRLIEVLPSWSFKKIPVYIVYPYNKHLLASIREFINFTINYIKINSCFSSN